MRSVLLISASCLWLNAFVGRAELLEAFRGAFDSLDWASRNGNGVAMFEAMVFGSFGVLSSSPAWKLIAGAFLFVWSTSPSRAA